MFIPQVTKDLTIDLPGERTRATVVRLVNDDTVIVKLTTMPMAKTHQYRFNDIIACQRQADGALETWNAIEERKTLPARLPPPTEKPDAAPAGRKPGSRKPKHPRNGRGGAPAKPSGGRVAEKRAPKPKSKRRARSPAR